ncbi:hypothetical protein HOY82DRAFT_602158 [Tuber indicum]|nr:hypothetical protein HOY82DRAFT_602158 [Tuber indicum]
MPLVTRKNLHKCFTRSIDTLENAVYPVDKMKESILAGKFAEGVSYGTWVVAEEDLVIFMRSLLSVSAFSALPGMAGGRADDVLVLGGCDAGMRKVVEELEQTQGLEEVWGRVGGGSDGKLRVEAESTEDA